MLTNRDILNRVREHLLTQGARSAVADGEFDPDDANACRYRGPGGLMCAVGCLITDEHYSCTLEGRNSNETPVEEALARSLGVATLSTETVDMLRRLQVVHDTKPIGAWPAELRMVERGYSELLDKPAEEASS